MATASADPSNNANSTILLNSDHFNEAECNVFHKYTRWGGGCNSAVRWKRYTKRSTGSEISAEELRSLLLFLPSPENKKQHPRMTNQPKGCWLSVPGHNSGARGILAWYCGTTLTELSCKAGVLERARRELAK